MLPYAVTERAQRCLASIEQLRSGLDRAGPLPRIWAGRTRRDLEAEAVAASTRLEGVAVTVDEARRILVGDVPPGVTAQDAAQVTGYREAMRYVLARADDPHFAWHTELVLAVHHRVLGGSAVGAAGRFRDGQNWVASGETGEQVYLPPPPDQVPNLTSRLMSWLSGFAGPAPVAAAVAHVAVAAIHPFRDGNGRTARIVASLVMYRSGYRAPQFTSLEEWWGRHPRAYYDSFACLGAEWTPSADVSQFVDAHVCAQASQIASLSLRNALDHAVWTALSDVATLDLGLRERTTHALYDAFFVRAITNRYYRGLADVTDVTAAHDLAKLAASGLLRRRGAGRSSRYEATPRLMQAAARGMGLDARLLDEGASLAAQRDVLLAALGRRLHPGMDHTDRQQP